MKMILEWEYVSNTADKDSRIPLPWAAGNGQRGVVKILLEREDVTPDSPDKGRRRPLSWAAELGYITVVEMLQELCGVS